MNYPMSQYLSKITREDAMRADAIQRAIWEFHNGELQVVQEGYRYDDPNGVSVFLDYDGKVKGTAS